MAGTIVDMHVHTVRGAADSSLTPDQLIEEARRIGLTGVNISEHDRVWEPHLLEETKVLGKRGIGASDCHSTQGVGYYVTVFEDELRDQENMLEQLRARRFHAAEGLPAGELRPYLEEPVEA